MTPNNTDEQIRHVFDEWHRAVKDQDAEGMARPLRARRGARDPGSAGPVARARGRRRARQRLHRAVLRAKLPGAQRRKRLRGLVPQRAVLLRRAVVDLGVSARNPEGRPDGHSRVHGSRERADHPPPRLLGMGGVQQAPQRHQQGPPVGSAVPPHRAGYLPSRPYSGSAGRAKARSGGSGAAVARSAVTFGEPADRLRQRGLPWP